MSIRDITDVRERVNHDEPCPNTKKDVLGVSAQVLSIIKQRYPLHIGSDRSLVTATSTVCRTGIVLYNQMLILRCYT